MPDDEDDYESAFSLDGIPGVDESIDDVDNFDSTDDDYEDPLAEYEESNSTQIHKIDSFGKLVGFSLFTLFWCGVTFTMIGSMILGAIYLNEAEENWDHHRGTILASGVTETYSDEDTTYCPWIEYQYTIDNVSYTNDQIGYEGMLGQTCTSSDYDWANDYPPGENITVHVNPANPQESIIDTSVDVGLFFFMTPFVLVGCFLLWLSGTSIYSAIYHPEKFHEDMSEWVDGDGNYEFDEPMD